MKKGKKLFALLLVLCLLVQVIPITAKAYNSNDLFEAIKDDVPLRHNYGSEYSIVSYISKKGGVVRFVDSAIKKVKSGNNTWLKVQVPASITNNNAGGIYWVFLGNLTKHDHHYNGPYCSNTSCPAMALSIADIGNQNVTISKGGAPLRAQPYNDGAVIKKYNVGEVITITGSLTNYKGNLWYRVADGNFIFSDNTSAASAAKSNAKNNSENNKSAGERAIDFISLKPAPCNHKYSQGFCKNCGAEFKLTITKVKGGSYQTNKDNAVARAIPYQSGAVKKTYGKAGTPVSINAKTTNSAGNEWFRTTDGYWIYGVEDVTLESVSVHASGQSGSSYVYQNLDAQVKLVYKTKPTNANITSVTWSSSNPSVVDVDKDGNLTRKSYDYGKTTITCTVKSKEGNTARADFEVTMPELLTLSKWQYNNQTYNYNLAMQCAEYMALAYERYSYKDVNFAGYGTRRVVFENKSDSAPRLANVLQEDGMNYKRYNFGNAKSYETSPLTIASKYVNYNGSKTPLIYVILTGSAGYMGWRGNMQMTGSNYNPAELQTHYTFRLAAQDAQNKLAQYASQFSKKPIVVVTGHSRGGAVGNLLAEYLNHDSRFEKVYAYNFAAPNATRNPSSSRNIYNICNTEDLVPMIPLSSWGYTKNGVTLQFTASQAYRSNSDFQRIMDQQMALNTEASRNKPNYSYISSTPTKLKSYLSGILPSVEVYYNRIPGMYGGKNYDDTGYHYMFEGLARAASNDNKPEKKEGISILLSHLAENCVFQPLSMFFVGNGGAVDLGAAFYDSHNAFTYYAAMLAGVKMSEVSAMSVFGDDEPAYGNGVVALNDDEEQIMEDFFRQDENVLMLEENGWDVNDPSTWEGVKWDMDGHIVKLDLGYMGLGGWLDVTDLPAIETLNVDGNCISMLAASGCEELTEVSCFMNQLTNLTVDECSKLQQLDCAFNEISSLDLSNLSRLEDVNCYSNRLTNLNLNGSTALQTLRCGGNNLTSVDVSTNTSLSTFFCDGNRILESANPQLVSAVNAINEAGGTAQIGQQQYLDGFGFNTDELESLTTFANASANLEKLGWDLDDPWSWEGVEWKIYGNEYHIAGLDLSGMDVEGDLNLPDAAYLETLSCDDTSLSTISLTGCSALNTVSCSNGEISELELSGCANLSALSCSGNFLAPDEVETTLNQLGLQTGEIDYADQKIAADEDNFAPQELEELLKLLCIGNNSEILGWDEGQPGAWNGVKWTADEDGLYHVMTLDLSDLEVQGKLDLTSFSYLEDFSFAGTALEQVVLPDSIAVIPEYAFYSSDVQFVSIPEGVTRINQSAFAYCETLQMIVLPSTLSKIEEKAFYGCSALKDLIFLGDEPSQIGSGALEDTSAQLVLTIRADRSWDEGCELLSSYPFNETNEAYIVRVEDGLALDEDSAYSETNQYPGTDVAVTLVRMDPEHAENLCILSVYSDDGATRSIHTKHVDPQQTVSHIVFEDVNLQFAGEELCSLKVFLLSGETDCKPLAKNDSQTLLKPVQTEE